MVSFLFDYVTELANALKGRTLGEVARENNCKVEDILNTISTLKRMGVIKDVRIVFIK